MAPKIQNKICSKCEKIITNSEYLTCSQCKKTLHRTCTTNVSFKRFNLMTKANKETWKCSKCAVKKTVDCDNATSNPIQSTSGTVTHAQSVESIDTPTSSVSETSFNTTMNPSTSEELNQTENESESLRQSHNVNMQSRLPARSCNDISILTENDPDFSLSFTSTTAISLPERDIDSEDIMEMKQKILDLTSILNGANIEIDNLSLENMELKKQLDQARKTIDMYKKIGSSSNLTPKSIKKRKILSKIDNTIIQRNKALINPDLGNQRVGETSKTEDKGYSKRCEKKEISDTKGKRNEALKDKSDTKSTTTTTQVKLCLISSNNNNKLLPVTERFFNETDFCHYLTPGGGVKQLLNGLGKKLCNYTLNDYCVIFIGESDFVSSCDYQSIVDCIREEIQKVQHTNVIICTPTYKYKDNVNLFNVRVELFNNLLYQDNLAHEYGYVLDSNKNIQYTSSMFSRFKGTINNNALMKIFEDLNNLIIDITTHSKDYNYVKKGTIPYYFPYKSKILKTTDYNSAETNNTIFQTPTSKKTFLV